MIEDMQMRKMTQSGYIRAVRRFAGYLGRSPDTAKDEDLRCYQLHRVDRGVYTAWRCRLARPWRTLPVQTLARARPASIVPPFAIERRS